VRKHGNCIIRESLFGGRTKAFKFHHTASSTEHIRYVDVTSMYPYVLKRNLFPVGHPIKITRNFDFSLKNVFGFVKCKILPPKKLFFPVLPMKLNNKLLFVLCRTCGENRLSAACTHSVEERALVNTWCSEEVKTALQHGYRILEIYEILHYQTTSDKLFYKYIDMWLKVKQEASGTGVFYLFCLMLIMLLRLAKILLHKRSS